MTSNDILCIPNRMTFPSWDCRWLSSFLVHSELCGWLHLCAELDGNEFFLEFTSSQNFGLKKWKVYVQKGAYVIAFLGKYSGGQKNGQQMLNFVLISKVFIRWGCNFMWRSTVHQPNTKYISCFWKKKSVSHLGI